MPRAHEDEPDAFDRQRRIRGHDQGALSAANVLVAGAGGLNSPTALGLVRAGVGSLTILDDDEVDLSNLNRQLFFAGDLGKPKASQLARNLVDHAVGGTEITGIPLCFEDATDRMALGADIVICGVDNNACRQACVRFARERGIPAVFTMLSTQGHHLQCFLQGAQHDSACLWCALPNLDVNRQLPCSAAILSDCFVAAGVGLFFAYRALMGWPDGAQIHNFREIDLLHIHPDRVAQVKRRPDCAVCSPGGT